MRVQTAISKESFNVEFCDKLTSSDLGDFRKLLSDIRQSGCPAVVLDLGALEWLDSAGLGMLILAKDLADKDNLKLVLKSPQGHVKSILDLGRFEKLFIIEA